MPLRQWWDPVCYTGTEEQECKLGGEAYQWVDWVEEPYCHSWPDKCVNDGGEWVWRTDVLNGDCIYDDDDDDWLVMSSKVKTKTQQSNSEFFTGFAAGTFAGAAIGAGAMYAVYRKK